MGVQILRYTKRTKMGLVLFVIAVFLTIPATTVFAQTSTIANSVNLSLNEKIVQERYIDTDDRYQLNTLMLYRDSIIRLNISVLLSSYSSIETCISEEYSQEFTPTLTNFTLAPGESFVEDYTILGNSIANELAFECRLVLPNSNATVQWWYEVLHSAKPDGGFIGIEAFFVVVSFIITGISLVYISKRKSSKKND